MITVITYGTFDLFHVGHLHLLERLSKLGDRLLVGVSTDEFNAIKGKQSLFSYSDRVRIVSALSCVDLVFPEDNWEQKIGDINKYEVDILGMGDDWTGKFNYLEPKCEVMYLPRMENVSSTSLRLELLKINQHHVEKIKHSLDSVLDLISKFG